MVLEDNLYSTSRSTKKPLGWTMSDAVFKFKNLNFSFKKKFIFNFSGIPEFRGPQVLEAKR